MNRKKLNEVLHKAYLDGFELQSNYARSHPQEVAALASMGMISTKLVRGVTPVFGRRWRITLDGIDFLAEEGIV